MRELSEEWLSMFEEALSVAQTVADKDIPASYDLLFDGDTPADERAAILSRIEETVAEGVTIAPLDIPAQNWLETVYEALPPLVIGRYVVHGTHVEPALEEGQERLVIVAATAFGTGQHSTTWGCLMAFQDILDGGFTPANCADIGTGSGILALAAHGTLKCPTLATDNDPESTRLTSIHAGMNNATPDFEVHLAEGVDAHISDKGPFDLVFANILAGPLKELAPDLASITAPHGYLILSGLLETQKDDVLAAYTAQGMKLIATRTREGWAALTLSR